MAVANFKRCNMVLVFRDQDEEGKIVTKRITLSNVNNGISEDEFFQVAQQLGNLTKYSFSHAERIVYEEILY